MTAFLKRLTKIPKTQLRCRRSEILSSLVYGNFKRWNCDIRIS